MNLGKRHQMLRRKGKIPTLTHKSTASSLDGLVYVVAIAGMVFTLDQVRIIWIDHNVLGVSLPTWAYYTFASCIWTVYGYKHKDNVIFLTSALWVIVEGLVALGLIIYR